MFSLAILLALLGKGPVGFFLVAYVLVFLAFVRRDLWLRYSLLATAASVPFLLWIGWQWHLNAQMMSEVLQQEYLERLNYDSSFIPSHIGSPLWYFERIWSHHRLTGVLGVVGLAAMVLKSASRNSAKNKPTVSLSWLFISGLAVCYLLLISLASHKHSRYILPIVPLLILITLYWLKFLWEEGGLRARVVASYLLVLSMSFGLYAGFRKYDLVPDYQPEARSIADALRPYVEAEGLQPFTDTPQRAVLVHFYLQKQVKVAATPNELPTGSVWVAPDAMGNLQYVTH
jgi:hypothetical protein